MIDKKTYNLSEAANACSTTRQTIKRHIDSGKLTAKQVLTYWIIKHSDLVNWAKTQNLEVN